MTHAALALVAAPLLLGILNRIKAVFAGRVGQPLLQPYYDLSKLLRKGAVYSRTTSWAFRAGPVVGLACAAAALLLVPLGPARAALAFPGDFVALAGLLALTRFATIVAALDTGSSFEAMGASREAAFGALAEPALLLGLAALGRQTGSLSLSDVFSGLADGALGSTPALALVAAALLAVLLAENCRIPVDDPSTHLELTMIHEVMVLDHGGPDLAFILYAAALKFWIFGALLAGVLFSWTGSPWLALAGMPVLAVAVGVIESCMARLRLGRVPQMLVGAGALSVLALILTMA